MKSVMNIWKETVNWTDDKVLIAVVASGAQRQFRKQVSMEEYYSTIQCVRFLKPLLYVKRISRLFAWLACCAARNTTTSDTRWKISCAAGKADFAHTVQSPVSSVCSWSIWKLSDITSPQEFARPLHASCSTNSLINNSLVANPHGKQWINLMPTVDAWEENTVVQNIFEHQRNGKDLEFRNLDTD